MISVISPAKTLDFECATFPVSTQRRFKNESATLIDTLRKKDASEVKSLMGISDALAELNVARYHSFGSSESVANAKTSLHAFKGDVYVGLDAPSLSDDDIDFAQNHLRILSGLYGLLRPLDLIEPYRLEMGTKLKFNENRNLYDFWADRIVDAMHNDLENHDNQSLINLASNEYFKALKRKSLKANVIDVEFKDWKNGQYKIISFFAKKARGLMARYIVQNQINEPEMLKSFDLDGYYYDANNSTDLKYCFKRDAV